MSRRQQRRRLTRDEIFDRLRRFFLERRRMHHDDIAPGIEPRGARVTLDREQLWDVAERLEVAFRESANDNKIGLILTDIIQRWYADTLPEENQGDLRVLASIAADRVLDESIDGTRASRDNTKDAVRDRDSKRRRRYGGPVRPRGRPPAKK